MKNKSQSQSAPEQAGNVNSPVVWMYEYYGLQNEWCSEEHWYQCVGTIKPMEGEFIRHIIPLYVYAIPEGYCIVPKQVLLDCDKAFTSNRVWNGQGWTQNPIHPFAFKKAAKLVRDELDRVFASPMNFPPPEISTDAVEAAGRCTACGDELI